MLSIYCMYRHFRRTGVSGIAAIKRPIHVYHHGF